MSTSDKPHINVPTDFIILESGLVYRDVRKVWIKSTCATMRLELLKHIQEENLRQIEIFVKNEARSRLSDKFKKKSIRDPSLIESIMRNKIKDAYQAVRETTLAKSLMKKKLNKIKVK